MTKLRIKSRFFLVALLIACQAASLGFGVIWATGWLWTTYEEVVNKHVLAEGQAQAHKMAVEISEMQLENVEPGSIDWWRLQELCENRDIAHQGFVCVMRTDNGAMICHPDLGENPSLLEMFPGLQILMNEERSAPIIDLVSESNHLVTGKVELDGELNVVTCVPLKSLNAVLAVYESDVAIDQFIAATIQPIMQVGYALTAFIVGVTAILTVFLINCYETSLAEANTLLEKQVNVRTRALVRTRNAVVFGLAKLTESRDSDTGQHLDRIRSYVTILATQLAKANTDIDHRFVADFCKVLDSEKSVVVDIESGDAAALFSTDDGYGYVVMPLARDG